MKLTKKEEKERMIFVLNCLDDYEEGFYKTVEYQNGFPNVILVEKITPLYLFSSQTNGEKAIYCGIQYGLINLELTKEEITDNQYISDEVNKQAEKRK